MRPKWVRSSSFDTETAANHHGRRRTLGKRRGLHPTILVSTHLFDDTPSEAMTDEDDRSGLLFRAQSFASNIS